jgi:hypothetical protein
VALRDEVYRQFGLAAEAAQLFETDLGTLLLALAGLDNGWHLEADSAAEAKFLDNIDAQTLGALLKRVKGRVNIDEKIEKCFASALLSRNKLMHGFFERHNLRMESNEGRDLMVADLSAHQGKLLIAWRFASS